MRTANGEDLSWAKYFKSCIERDKDRPALIKKPKKCSECAADNMYFEITKALGKEPLEVQRKISEHWFCHLHASTQCNGVYEFISTI